MTLPPITGIEQYVKQDGRLTFAGQQLWQEIINNINTLDTRMTSVENGTLIAHAVREVLRVYGDVVSVEDAAESVIKFGEHETLGTSQETIWSVTGDETYLTTDLIDTISSSDALDIYETHVMGHSVTGTGVDTVFTVVHQNVTLDGQNKVPLTTPIARSERMFNDSGTELVGKVSVYEDTAISGGVPTDVTKIHNEIPAGKQQSFKAATTTSDGQYLFISKVFGSVRKKTAASVDFILEIRLAGKVFRERIPIGTSTNGGPADMDFSPYLIVPPNSDIRVTSVSSAVATSVSANFSGFIAEVVT